MAALALWTAWWRGADFSPIAAATAAERGPAARDASPWAPVVAALRRGDLDETARLANLAGRGPLRAALLGHERLAATAALVALAARAEPWPLEELAQVASSPDRRRAQAAVTVARVITARLAATGQAGAEASALDAEALRQAQARWLEVARPPGRWSDVRADSLEIAAQLGDAALALGDADAPAQTVAALRGWLDDADPALRRAAVELLPAPAPPALRAELVRRLLAEPEPGVARAAVAALCAELAGAPPEATAPVLAALGAAGLERTRALARESRDPGAAEVELARCLRADDSSASRGALQQLRAVARGPVRRALDSVERGAR